MTFLESVALTLQEHGREAADAARVAETLLPDVLFYDYTSTAGYPNGRRLDDDVVDFMLALLTNGQHPTDFVGPHTDLLPDFPYSGPRTASVGFTTTACRSGSCIGRDDKCILLAEGESHAI